MKGGKTLLFLLLVLLTQGQTQELSDEEYVEKLEDELESLSPQFITNFVSFYHLPT
jgi:radical SAM superfamily enzyme